MSYADIVLRSNLILALDGVSDFGQDVRPRWHDGSPAYSKKVFGVLNEYDLSKEFPITTLRPTAFKSGLKEVLWIYQDKSNSVDLLEEKYGVHFWREWANEEGDLGTAYGYQMSIKNKYKEGYFDQVDRLIYDLKNNPYSRRMLTNLYNHDDLHEMTLYPCAFLTMWDYDGEKLNMTLVQRSSDYIVAGNINVTEYALLQHMIAQSCGYKVGKFNHYINNLHIYSRHEEQALSLIRRNLLPAPKLVIDDSIRNFYDFKPEHFELENYQTHTQLKFEVAL